MFKSDMTEMILQECNKQGLIPMGSDIAKLQKTGTGIAEEDTPDQST